MTLSARLIALMAVIETVALAAGMEMEVGMEAAPGPPPAWNNSTAAPPLPAPLSPGPSARAAAVTHVMGALSLAAGLSVLACGLYSHHRRQATRDSSVGVKELHRDCTAVQRDLEAVDTDQSELEPDQGQSQSHQGRADIWVASTKTLQSFAAWLPPALSTAISPSTDPAAAVETMDKDPSRGSNTGLVVLVPTADPTALEDLGPPLPSPLTTINLDAENTPGKGPNNATTTPAVVDRDDRGISSRLLHSLKTLLQGATIWPGRARRRSHGPRVTAVPDDLDFAYFEDIHGEQWLGRRRSSSLAGGTPRTNDHAHIAYKLQI